MYQKFIGKNRKKKIPISWQWNLVTPLSADGIRDLVFSGGIRLIPPFKYWNKNFLSHTSRLKIFWNFPVFSGNNLCFVVLSMHFIIVFYLLHLDSEGAVAISANLPYFSKIILNFRIPKSQEGAWGGKHSISILFNESRLSFNLLMLLYLCFLVIWM